MASTTAIRTVLENRLTAAQRHKAGARQKFDNTNDMSLEERRVVERNYKYWQGQVDALRYSLDTIYHVGSDAV
jgi:outer membrane PBP1 activator LpoA protein